ncbi:NAD(P)-binding protein [Calocera cornea HHB12733]|uniref:NAD(P)-binding protein n=1 Tax=Calocera cornea HHB12733 TaxID=1353952 RepID=A0A165HZ17_9BASI|nr:NAD(P)-binding protein [Calocera cornea HHB12733]
MDKPSLTEAFKGAYAVFGVTKPFTPNSETAQGKNLVDACVANKVPLFVWSSLPSTQSLKPGTPISIPLMDEKAAVEEYIKEVGQPAVVFHTGSFVENLFTQGLLQTTGPGKWEIRYPIAPADKVQPFTYIEADLGPSVEAIIGHWEDASWQEKLTKEPILMCSYRLTGAEMAETLSKLTGKEVKYAVQIETIPEPRRSLYTWSLHNWDYYGPIPPQILLDLGVKFHTFEDFVHAKVAAYMSEKDSA